MINLAIASSIVKMSPSTQRYSESNKPREFANAEFSISSALKNFASTKKQQSSVKNLDIKRGSEHSEEEKSLERSEARNPSSFDCSLNDNTENILVSRKTMNENLHVEEKHSSQVFISQKNTEKHVQITSELYNPNQIVVTDMDIIINGISPERVFQSPPKSLDLSSSRQKSTGESGSRKKLIFAQDETEKKIHYDIHQLTSSGQFKHQIKEDAAVVRRKEEHYSITGNTNNYNAAIPRQSVSSKSSIDSLDFCNSTNVILDADPKKFKQSKMIFSSGNLQGSTLDRIGWDSNSLERGLCHKKRYYHEHHSFLSLRKSFASSSISSSETIYNPESLVIAAPKSTQDIGELIALIHVSTLR